MIRRSPIPADILLIIAAGILFLIPAGGCEFFLPGGDSDKPPPTNTVLVNVGELYPGTHLTLGESTVDDGIHYLSTPTATWPETAVGPYLYLVSADAVYTYQCLQYLVEENTTRLVVIPIDHQGGEHRGIIFWNEDNLFEPEPPRPLDHELAPETIERTLDAAVEAWEIPPEREDSLEAVYIGGNNDGLMFWVAESPLKEFTDYADDLALVRHGPARTWFGDSRVDATFTVPGGADLSSTRMSDLNGDGFADLLAFELLGDGAPTYAYIRDANGAWRWTMRYNH